MVLERVEVTLVKNAHYILLEVEFLDDSLLIYLINSKEASRKTSKIWLKLGLLKDMETFQTLQTWIGHNATRYHNLNALPHALPYISLRFAWFWRIICNALPRLTIII